jgi:uncharacterized membrane protein
VRISGQHCETKRGCASTKFYTPFTAAKLHCLYIDGDGFAGNQEMRRLLESCNWVKGPRENMSLAGGRSWVSPITALCFAILAITGILMMLHIRIPGFHGLHQWMGILFCVVAGLHLLLNWRSMLKYLRTRQGIAAVVTTAILAAIVMVGANDEKREREHKREAVRRAEQSGCAEAAATTLLMH